MNFLCIFVLAIMSVEILEKPSIRSRVNPVSVEQYHRLYETGIIPEKTELIEGVIISKMPKSPEHSYTTGCLEEMMRDIYDNEYYVRKEEPITLQNSEPEPDISIVKGKRGDFKKKHPQSAEMVIEVSASTYDLDKDKQFIYAQAGIPECWIVNLDKLLLHTKLK